MSREIKFRVFDTHSNEYFKPIYRAYEGMLLDLSIGLSGRLMRRTLEKPAEDESLFPSQYIVEQFTGLKDRHGVEIFESDAIQSPNTTIWIVRWNNDNACFEAYSGSVVMSPIDNINCIVIGNIHANIHLL